VILDKSPNIATPELQPAQSQKKGRDGFKMSKNLPRVHSLLWPGSEQAQGMPAASTQTLGGYLLNHPSINRTVFTVSPNKHD